MGARFDSPGWQALSQLRSFGSRRTFAPSPLLATMDAFKMIAAPSGISGSAFRTVKTSAESEAGQQENRPVQADDGDAQRDEQREVPTYYSSARGVLTIPAKSISGTA